MSSLLNPPTARGEGVRPALSPPNKAAPIIAQIPLTPPSRPASLVSSPSSPAPPPPPPSGRTVLVPIDQTSQTSNATDTINVADTPIKAPSIYFPGWNDQLVFRPNFTAGPNGQISPMDIPGVYGSVVSGEASCSAVCWAFASVLFAILAVILVSVSMILYKAHAQGVKAMVQKRLRRRTSTIGIGSKEDIVLESIAVGAEPVATSSLAQVHPRILPSATPQLQTTALSESSQHRSESFASSSHRRETWMAQPYAPSESQSFSQSIPR